MHGRISSSRTRILALTALVAGFQLAHGAAQADDGDSLKWTPHRASTPRVDFEADAVVPTTDMATEPRETSPPSRGPATVTLPDRVPVVSTTPRAPAAAPAVRTVRPARPAPRVPESDGVTLRVYDPAKPDALFGVKVMRTPQPASSQPRMATVPRDRQGSSNDQRYRGGLAPRYAPAGQRPERLAMNADGIPSVMRQPASNAPETVPSPHVMTNDRLPTPAGDIPGEPMEAESIGPGLEMPDDSPVFEMPGQYSGSCAPGGDFDGMSMGGYPSQLHVESFYDDPYACDDEENELGFSHHDGRICRWLRQFGRPYYGWRWYRDFTASGGVTSFTNPTDLGINGNYGTNEYLNFAMPFWNAFGIGWQVGARGVQTNFQPTTLNIGGTQISKNARDQQFVTTGFFTRAFEGRGLQGGVVYDYMQDSWFENADLAQLRYELSYVWGYHEFGFWGASNVADQNGLFGKVSPHPGVASTLALYTGFYRVQFGDANELKIWGGGTSEQDGIIGALVRAPMHRSLAVEGTFTYVLPNRNQVVPLGPSGDQFSFSPSAWNMSLNLVWYPAARSRRGLASPYRPLFEVADNGSMIRSLEGITGP